MMMMMNYLISDQFKKKYKIAFLKIPPFLVFSLDDNR